VAKPELGTKRVCPTTGRKFYDLNQNPVISPYTGQIVPIEAPVTRGRAEARAAVPEKEEAEVPEAQEAELVSLEDADAEASGGKVETSDVDDEDDTEVEGGDEDDTFLEQDEDEDDDVSDIIGGDIEGEEET
jgi:uncharacterized protein (TIGR02300 family)